MADSGKNLVQPYLTIGGAVPLRYFSNHHTAGSGWVWLESQVTVLHEHRI